MIAATGETMAKKKKATQKKEPTSAEKRRGDVNAKEYRAHAKALEEYAATMSALADDMEEREYPSLYVDGVMKILRARELIVEYLSNSQDALNLKEKEEKLNELRSGVDHLRGEQ